MISVVMSVLSVAICVWVFGFRGVRSGCCHSVQIELVVVRVHGLSVRLTLVIFVVAVGRLSAVVAHVRHRRLGQRRGVLGARVATHRSWQVGQNTRYLLLVRLSGAHGENKQPSRVKVPGWILFWSRSAQRNFSIKNVSLSVCVCARSVDARLWKVFSPLKLSQLQ